LRSFRKNIPVPFCVEKENRTYIEYPLNIGSGRPLKAVWVGSNLGEQEERIIRNLCDSFGVAVKKSTLLSTK